MSGTFLNFLHIQFSLKEIEIERIPNEPFKTKESFFKLRDENKNIRFYKIKNWIYYWSNSSTNFSNSEKIKVSIENEPNIFCRILEDSIIEKIKEEKSISAFKQSYSNTWKILNNKDILENRIPGIALKKYTEINCTYYRTNQINIVLCVSSGLANSINLSKKDLKSAGIEVDDLKGRGEEIFPNKESIKRIVESTGKLQQFNEFTEKNESKAENCKRIFKLYDWINKNKNNFAFPSGLKLLSVEKLYLPYQNHSIREDIIPTPKYFFYSEQIGSGLISNRVKSLKPYTYEKFQAKQIKIGIIAPKQNEGTTETFVKKLDNHLREIFSLKNIEYKFSFISSLSLESYSIGLYEANFNFRELDLVLVIISTEHKKLPVKKDPYYFCKAKLMGQKIPSQEILIDRIQNHNNFILDNIALNIYAKLGGTPWIIQKEDKLKNELIIGIASSIDEENKRILGIAQIFNYNGKYLVTNCTPLSTFENYSANLENYLTSQIKNHIRDDGSEIRLIFHLFKPAGKSYEIKAVEALEKLVANLKLPKLSFALVHLGYGHNFRIFTNDGKDNNRKGSFLQLDSHKGLLIINPNSSIPLLIEIDRRSNFKDLYYLSKQVFSFSHLSFRSYMPSKKSVTLLYPNLIAKFTNKLKNIDGWDYELLNTMEEKLWFI